MSKKPQQPDNRELVADGFATIKDACKYLSVSTATIYDLMNSGAIRYAKVGRVRRIPWRSLHDYAASRIVDVGPQT